jgi:4'-phosphopantetheinyl transferase
MPLYLQQKYPDNLEIAIWKVTETEDELYENLLDIEKIEFGEFVHPKKRLEYLGARNLLASITQKLGIFYNGISKDETGKPFLIENSSEISISHCLPWIGVVLHPIKPVGIDIERPQEKLEKVAPRVFSESEINFSKNNLDLITKIWCAKEVLYKIYAQGGNTFKTDFLVEDFQEQNNIFNASIIMPHFQKDYQIHTFNLEKDVWVCFGKAE